ncbi:hypothetical protein N8996_01700 [Candidatus Poseidonia alphae]|nr:hypothetical protein [Candidatus Poseidonia alphae]
MTLFQYLPDDCLYIIKQYLPSKFKVILEKNDLVDYIYSFLPLKDKMLINRKYYYQLQSQIIIPYEKEDKLMIDLVKKNCMIGVKKYVTKEKIDKLTKNKKYYFGNQVFFNLFSLLEQISIQYKYNQMREYLRTLLVNKKLNKYKNKVYKNIIWK